MTADLIEQGRDPAPAGVEGPAEASYSSRGLLALALHRFARRPVPMAALATVTVVFVVGALSHSLIPRSWTLINLSPSEVHLAPTLKHPFGTDALGRDMLARTLFGVRTTEEVGLAAAALATLIGASVGMACGYFGGWFDVIVMRVADLATAYPAILLTLAAITYFGTTSPTTMILIFGGFMWAIVARVIRAEVAALREAEFVASAHALGASNLRVLCRHVLPNTTGTVLVAATSLVGQIILIDATVEFFAYGLPSAVTPSLGNLVADVVRFKFGLSNEPITAAFGWWTWFFPSLVLVVILVCLNLVGDALDTALNPSAVG